MACNTSPEIGTGKKSIVISGPLWNGDGDVYHDDDEVVDYNVDGDDDDDDDDDDDEVEI